MYIVQSIFRNRIKTQSCWSFWGQTFFETNNKNVVMLEQK